MTEWYSLPGIYQPVSSLSHLMGAIVFAVVSWRTLQSVWNDRCPFWTIAIFAGSTELLLSLSAIYHMFGPGALRAIMLRLDVAAIFLLIAGSFTPLHGILFEGWKRWGMLALIWTVALAGIALRIVFFDSISKPVGHAGFLMMGWLGAISGYLVWKHHGWGLLLPVVAGGVLYTLGAISNAVKWPTIIPYVWGPHETHHMTVLAGLGFHWWATVQIAAKSVPSTTSLEQEGAERAPRTTEDPA